MTDYDIDALLAHRAAKDDAFRHSEQSPLTPVQQAAFTGLRYDPPNPALALMLTLEPDPDGLASPVRVETTHGEVRHYVRAGHFTVPLADGQTVRLTLFATPHGTFLPFVDSRAGQDTYPAGRYLDLEPLDPRGRTFWVDFNMAYNPLCAYNDAWTCPLTPPENRLSVPILAGELLPDAAWAGLTD